MTKLRYSLFFNFYNSEYLYSMPNISSGSGKEADFVIFAIFSNGGHLRYSI